MNQLLAIALTFCWWRPEKCSALRIRSSAAVGGSQKILLSFFFYGKCEQSQRPRCIEGLCTVLQYSVICIQLPLHGKVKLLCDLFILICSMVLLVRNHIYLGRCYLHPSVHRQQCYLHTEWNSPCDDLHLCVYNNPNLNPHLNSNHLGPIWIKQTARKLLERGSLLCLIKPVFYICITI